MQSGGRANADGARRAARLLAACGASIGLLIGFACAFAQGGPPLVTDDPGTPGDGRWEINLATTGAHGEHSWNVNLFDADINYGVGDNVQLNLDVPWSYIDATGQGGRSGLGAIDAGVKWRFVDEADAGFSMSTYPHYLSAWSASSRRRGIASADDEFYLPVEFSKTLAGYEFAAELGRNFIERQADEWKAGVVVGHACFGAADCLVEVHRTWVAHDNQTLVNFGLHWELTPSVALLAAAGRDVGGAPTDRQSFVFYFGVQLLR